ncbi:MAG: hypothetical protein L3J71_04765 [Victivallaceae bacterium]|nr:hypothetical protein [Victivallaceae bacterium]
MQQVVCTKCRCSNQFGTIFCRNCGKKLPELDMNHPDRKIQNGMKDIFKRLMKLILVLAILALIGAIVLPIGFKADPDLWKNELKTANKTYELMAKRIADGDGFNNFVMTPSEAGYIATKFITPLPPEEDDKKDQAETEDEVKDDTPVDPGKITCATNKDELTIVYAKTYYKVLQCRIEITGKFIHEEIEPVEEDDTVKKKKRGKQKKPETEFKYIMTGARIGHIPMPKLLFPHMLELFKSMVFDRKITRSISLVEDLKVDSNDITLSFKKQIK